MRERTIAAIETVLAMDILDGGEVEIKSVAPAKELLKRLQLEKMVGDQLTAAVADTNIHALAGAIDQVTSTLITSYLTTASLITPSLLL